MSNFAPPPPCSNPPLRGSFKEPPAVNEGQLLVWWSAYDEHYQNGQIVTVLRTRKGIADRWYIDLDVTKVACGKKHCNGKGFCGGWGVENFRLPAVPK